VANSHALCSRQGFIPLLDSPLPCPSRRPVRRSVAQLSSAPPLSDSSSVS
jgi:hypothetical protein